MDESRAFRLTQRVRTVTMTSMVPPFGKRFVARLSTMVESCLLTWEFWEPWADDLISGLGAAPTWVLDLSTIRYQPDAVRVLRTEVSSPPFEEFNSDEQTDEYLACLLLRYRRGEISWATVLREGGLFLDRTDGHRHCEWLYRMLTELQHDEYSQSVENRQCMSVTAELADALGRVEPLYLDFLERFRRNVKSSGKREGS
jgi:hypothetical protein